MYATLNAFGGHKKKYYLSEKYMYLSDAFQLEEMTSNLHFTLKISPYVTQVSPLK